MSVFVNQKAVKDQQVTKKRRKADKNEDEKAEELQMIAIQALILETVKIFVSRVVGLNIHVLWKDQKIDENFVKALVNTGFELLEHDKSKNSELKPELFNLLQQTMEKYGGGMSHMQS